MKNRSLKLLYGHLDEAGIDYTLIGGLAVAGHKAPRTTLDIDILIAEQLAKNLGDILFLKLLK